MRSARAAIDKAGGDVLLVGRCECFLVGKPDIVETVARLKAYSSAGADCLYAPGIRTREQVAAVVEAAAPKPVMRRCASSRVWSRMLLRYRARRARASGDRFGSAVPNNCSKTDRGFTATGSGVSGSFQERLLV